MLSSGIPVCFTRLLASQLKQGLPQGRYLSPAECLLNLPSARGVFQPHLPELAVAELQSLFSSVCAQTSVCPCLRIMQRSSIDTRACMPLLRPSQTQCVQSTSLQASADRLKCMCLQWQLLLP